MSAHSRTAHPAAQLGTGAAGPTIAEPSFVEALAALLGPDVATVRLLSVDRGFPRVVVALDSQGRNVRVPLDIPQVTGRWISQRFPGLNRHQTHELELVGGHLVALADADDLPLAA